MSRPVAKRQDVMEAALRLFVEKGIEGTSTREIAQLAHAGEGTMFRHFASKEDLAWHLFHDNLSSFMKQLEAVTVLQTSAKAKVRSMVEAGYTLYETNPVLCSFLLLTEHSAGRRMGPDYRTPITLMTEIIREGQQRGEIQPLGAHLAAALIFGAVIRVPIFKRSGLIVLDLREMVDEVTDRVWLMIRA
jgi:AcrR family transcriptional regulator